MPDFDTYVHQVFYRHTWNEVCLNLAVYSFRPTAGNRGGSISIIICERRPAMTPNVYYLTVHLPSSTVGPNSLHNVGFEISKTTRLAASVLTGEIQEFLNVKLAHLHFSFGDNLAINARVEVAYTNYVAGLNDCFENLMLGGHDRMMMEEEMRGRMGMKMGMVRVGEIGKRDFIDESCTICDGAIMERNEQMKMSCGHYFHYTCFVERFVAMNRNCCSICRSPFVPRP